MLRAHGTVMKYRKVINNKILDSFEPGFYFDCGTVYVDLGEFINAHGMRDVPALRDVIWAESQRVFSGIPIQKLQSGICFTTKEKAGAPLGAALYGPRFWKKIKKNESDA